MRGVIGKAAVFSVALGLAIGSIPLQARSQSKSASAGAAQSSLVTRDPSTLSFPRHYWAPEIRANLAILEFLRTDWDTRLKLDPPPTGAAVIEEIRHLHALAAQRGERREEIKAQADHPFLSYFFPPLMMHQGSHPRTYELMSFAYGLAPVVIPFKHRFNRARPSQLAPTLNPMITVPGHPAYPSGHGFQSWMIALVLAELRPDAQPVLQAVAQRIGENREVAGVHYPSDTKAGQMLADQALRIAMTGRHFQETLSDARAEWR